MKNIIDWAGQRARMVLFFVILSLIAGFYSYINLPKEGEPDIEIPVVFISVPFQGISAEDSEALLIKPLEKELSELKEAINNQDIKEVADALTDILYVTYGAGHAFGIDLDKCFDEVQRSNMSKLGVDGKPIYNEKGKVMKGPNYFEPDLNKFVA